MFECRAIRRWLCLAAFLAVAFSFSAASTYAEDGQVEINQVVALAGGITSSDTPLSAMLADIPPTFSTPEIRLTCPDEHKFDVVATLAARFREKYDVIDIDGVRIPYPDGWSLLRASNTQPVLVARFEALTRERLDEIREEMFSQLREFPFVELPD